MEKDQNRLSRAVITTKDGSNSIFVPELDEHYHSVHGAIQEALHVFIDRGLGQCSIEPIRILEVGFGTGLNCLLTCLTGREIFYHGVEAYPVQREILNKLNYSELTGDNMSLFKSIHEASWQSDERITPNFRLLKDQVLIQEIELTEQYNLIYFDAFGPRAQKELWDPKLYRKLYSALTINGIFVTYCAQGQVRRDLQNVGFKVERLPGPPGKREMLRGTKV